MKDRHLETIAAAVISQTMRQLPESIRSAAQSCVVETVLMADSLQDDETLDDDLLGLFEGRSHGEAESEFPVDLPRIRLFLDNLWDYSGRDRATYRQEVRLTLLHELGHYLGLDEAQVEALGLA